jgi:hypothetical protein
MAFLLRFAVAWGAVLWAGGAASANDCRPADAPPGVRVPDRPGCKPSPPGKLVESGLKTGREPGFIDLGNGTDVRVSGRVRVDLRGAR